MGTTFVLLVSGIIVSTSLAVAAKRSAREAQSANEAMKRAEARERETARRLVVFLKQNPALIREKSAVIIAAFLQSNTDLTEDDIRDAFTPLSSAYQANSRSPGILNPQMFGD